jgi:GDP-L-fucose synthase
MNFFKNKKILVTGGTGLIGRPLVKYLVEFGARVTIVSLDSPTNLVDDVSFIQSDLRNFESCLEVTKDMDVVFHLAGVKGSPAMTAQKPARFFVPTISFNTNMMEASFRQNVKSYLYTSSIGVYAPAEIFYEDAVWKTFPSPNDKFAGWAKRMGELQAEAYKIENNWNNISIVRPANVYGPYDNFDPNTAMVIPSLIHRILTGENPLNVWGDGSAIRDFIFSSDVAYGMLLAVSKGCNQPLNLGSGTGVSIKQVIDILQEIIPKLDVTWDTSKPTGDKMRIMDTKRSETLIDFKPQVSLKEGILQTYNWYKKNKDISLDRYNSFTEKK